VDRRAQNKFIQCANLYGDLHQELQRQKPSARKPESGTTSEPRGHQHAVLRVPDVSLITKMESSCPGLAFTRRPFSVWLETGPPTGPQNQTW